MNPNNYEQPGLSLPEPVGEGEMPARSPERGAVSSPEVSPIAPPAMPAQAIALTPASMVAEPTTAVQPMTGSSPASSVPMAADDADLIEKEWVLKAKAIVDRTREDPRQQTKEMNTFKAEYLKKRYNKDIKVTES